MIPGPSSMLWIWQKVMSSLTVFASCQSEPAPGVRRLEWAGGVCVYVFQHLPTEQMVATELLKLLGGIQFFEKYGLRVNLFPGLITLQWPDYYWPLQLYCVPHTEHVCLVAVTRGFERKHVILCDRLVRRIGRAASHIALASNKIEA